jgi:hypothetical protein
LALGGPIEKVLEAMIVAGGIRFITASHPEQAAWARWSLGRRTS